MTRTCSFENMSRMEVFIESLQWQTITGETKFRDIVLYFIKNESLTLIVKHKQYCLKPERGKKLARNRTV